MLLFVCGQGSLIWSEQYLSSGNAAILFATLPIWFVIFDRPNWNSYFKSANLIFGITIGFAGIILLFFDKSEAAVPSSSGSIEIIACFVILFGIICWVTASLYYRSHLSSGSVFLNLSIQLISASIICLVISFSFREFAGFAIIDISFAPTVAVLYLAIAGSIIAFAAYSWLLTQRTPVSVGTFAYINPLIAVFLGWLLANEKITMLQQFAMLNVAGSAFLINKNKKSG
ncbi:MAG: EamA family transporter [Pyrinomonadaceae bacterium]